MNWKEQNELRGGHRLPGESQDEARKEGNEFEHPENFEGSRGTRIADGKITALKHDRRREKQDLNYDVNHQEANA